MKYSNNFDWDTEEPLDGHEIRFLNKLENLKQTNTKKSFVKTYSPYFSWAAVVVLSFCFGIYYYNQNYTKVESTSTELYFANKIELRLQDLKELETPLTKDLINDAIAEITLLENDYKKLEIERKQKGLNESLLNAMIVNMQTRLDFLQKVQKLILQLNDFKSPKNDHENNI